MNLSYRGISYQSAPAALDVIDTTQTGQFLGNTFPIKRAILTSQHTDAHQLKYRGTHYAA